MRVGTVREIKTLEFRVGLTPAGARELTAHGHEVFVETGAGAGIGIADSEYQNAGAKILPDAPGVFAASDMIVKVKEPQASEIAMLKPHHILFTYLHLAADRDQTVGPACAPAPPRSPMKPSPIRKAGCHCWRR